MKKIIIALLFLSFKLNSSAQLTLRYDTCHYLQQYEGEWMQANGQDTIRVYLRFHRDSSASERLVTDVLYGWYECKHGSSVTASSYRKRFAPLSYDYDSPTAYHPPIGLQYKAGDCGDNLILLGIILQTQPGNVTTSMIRIDSSKTKMYWGGEPGIFPEYMTLIKQ